MTTEALHSRLLKSAPGAAPGAAAGPTLSAVYEAEFDYVFRCLRALGVRADQVDDALQDVFLVVSDKLATFDGRSALRTWLYAIALRVARRYRERMFRDAQRFVEDSTAHVMAADRTIERNLDLDLARRALAGLDARKREVFVLSMVEQLSAPEIAEVTGLPVNTVYSRVRAARAAFNDQVARILRGDVRRRR